MTQPNVPDRPQDGETRPAAAEQPGPSHQPDATAAGAGPPPNAPRRPVDAGPPHPGRPDRPGRRDDAGRSEQPGRPNPGSPSPPPVPPAGRDRNGATASGPTAAGPGPSIRGPRPASPRPDGAGPSTGRAVTRRSVIARLALVVPLVVGVLVVEGLFAATGQSGDIVSLPAAGVALVLIWMGVAWALHSWVALLMTFVPAVMVTLGAAMVGGLSPGAGAALVLVGTALVAAIVSFRLSAPARGWSPGWTAGPRTAAGSWPPVGSWPPAGATPGSHSVRAEPAADGPAGDDAATAGWYRTMFRPLDPLGAHFLHPRSTGKPQGEPSPPNPPGSDRPAPVWDTSATDRGARDRLVALLCRRGGAAGPTLATLEEFFTGNGDPRSIAPGLRGAVPLATVRAVLHRVREHRAVAELLVQVEPLEAGRYPAGEWPVAGSLHVIATLDADELDGMLTALRPEPAIGPLPVTELTSGGPAPAGSGEFAIWWA